MQSKYWDPYIGFCERNFELKFKKNYTIMPLIQEISNTDKVLKVLDSMDKYTLTAFFFLVEVTNSIIISLNILYKSMSYNLVWRDCNLEDEYNQLKWGIDEEFKKKLLYKKNFFIDIIDYIKIILIYPFFNVIPNQINHIGPSTIPPSPAAMEIKIC